MSGAVLADLVRCRNIISFEPPSPFEPVAGVPATEAVLRAALRELYGEGWRCVVTYSLDPQQGLDRVPRLASETGFRCVIAGLFWYDSGQLAREKVAAVSELQYIDAFVLGNEGLLGNRYTKAQLANEMADLRSATGKPVATSEPDGIYLADPSLLSLGDWIFPNIHPWFANVRAPAPAAASIEARVEALRALAPGRIIVVKEAWWPTGGGDPAATESNQSAFFRALAGSSVKFVWGESYDQSWKTGEGSQGPHWGLHANDHAKLVIAQLRDVYRSAY